MAPKVEGSPVLEEASTAGDAEAECESPLEGMMVDGSVAMVWRCSYDFLFLFLFQVEFWGAKAG